MLGLILPSVRQKSASVAPAEMIAVLPFSAPGAAGANSYFTTGMQEEILADLRRINGLVTLSPRSIVQAGEKANDVGELRKVLGVSYVLRGKVQPGDERTGVQAEVVDARSAKPVWTKKFDTSLAQIANVPREIAEQIVVQIKGTLTTEEKAAIARTPDR